MVEINLLDNKDAFLRRVGKRLPNSADMLESDDEFLVLINVPGCDEDDIDLRFVSGSLKVRAERGEEHEGYDLVSEGRPKRIAETVPVPAEVEVEDAEAKYEDGVLRVRLPKAPEAIEPEETGEVGGDETDGYHEVGVSEPETEVVFDEEGDTGADGKQEAETGDEAEKEESKMPSTAEALEEMSYRDLQGVAKELDIKANQSTEDLVEEITDELDL
jgi:HSP20 family molecular chaperone IbpA